MCRISKQRSPSRGGGGGGRRARERRSEEEEEELNSSSSKFVLLFPSFSGLWESAPEIFYFFLLQGPGPLRVCVCLCLCVRTCVCVCLVSRMRFNEGRKNKTHTQREEKNLFSLPPSGLKKERRRRRQLVTFGRWALTKRPAHPSQELTSMQCRWQTSKKCIAIITVRRIWNFFPDLDVSTEKDRRNSR